ncbi:MAG: ATP-binding protein [bacterium]|nr:ATP-binding protein [bacterium]
MAIKNITGQPARGKNFFNRPTLVHQFHAKIDSGSSILISAPRRVGKTSLMFHVKEKGMEGYHFIYLITESINSENEYFKHILNKIFDTEFLTPLQKISKKTYEVLKDRGKRVLEVGKSIKFDKESTRDYREEFIDTVKSIDLEGRKIVLMIDEFSQTLENIIDDEDKNSAVRFLQANRELRQDPEISQKVQFVFAGSIGLENIVNRLNSINLVNDLESLKVPPLSTAESHRLIAELCENKPFDLGKTNRVYMLDRIQWYIPYYIQLAVMEISDICLEKETESEGKKTRITKKLIDDAFSRMLEYRQCFEHWLTRLRKAFKAEDYSFAKELLNIISQKESIETGEVLNLAQKFDIPGGYRDIVNSLVYDGYINNNDDPKVYRFNSPLLKMWWWKNVAY